MEVFSLVGKIAVNFSDAVSKIDKVSNAADDAADSLNDVSDAAEDSQNPIKGSGNAASDADSKFSAWQMTLANLAANAIQGIINKVGELAQKIGEFAASSVSNFAEFEQLAGGTELMFGDAADYVMQKSEEAYRTVQMSQNDYLQQVNGFAVGLKTALGGNEQAAAELAHKIITAEADIVAATGNSQEAVQNAFNGIMKSNYTMLDNLQLGITPTKEGFQEVIDKVNEWNAANGNATHYMIDNLADCQAALVDYVEMQGLAGYASNEAGSTIQGSWSSVLALFENIKTKVGEQLAPVVMGFLQQLSGWMETVDWDAFAAKLGESFGKLTEWIGSIDFTTFFDAGINGVTGFVEKLGGLIEKLISIIENMSGFMDTLQILWPIILGVATAIGTFSAALKIVDIIKNVATALKALWAVLLANPIVAIVALIAGLIVYLVNLWNTNEEFRAKVTEIWNSIKTAITNAVNAIKTGVTNAFNAVKTTVTNIFEGIKNTATTIWNGIKETISNAINGAKNTVTNVLNAIKSTFSTVFNGIKSFLSPVVDWLKGIFNFEWSLPHIKLPHFSISGSFSLNPPSIPHFSVSWYKAAMEDGMILNEPTIFGFNPKTNQFLAGGEAGSEAVVGTESLSSMIKEAVAGEDGEVVEVLGFQLDRLFELLSYYLPILANLKVVLDSGALVGEIVGEMDDSLGDRYRQKERGVLA